MNLKLLEVYSWDNLLRELSLWSVPNLNISLLDILYTRMPVALYDFRIPNSDWDSCEIAF